MNKKQRDEQIKYKIRTLKDERKKAEKTLVDIDLSIIEVQKTCSHMIDESKTAYSRVWTCHNKFRCSICGHVEYTT